MVFFRLFCQKDRRFGRKHVLLVVFVGGDALKMFSTSVGIWTGGFPSRYNHVV